MLLTSRRRTGRRKTITMKSRSVAGAGSAMEPLVISGDTSARRKVSYDSGGETDREDSRIDQRRCGDRGARRGQAGCRRARVISLTDRKTTLRYQTLVRHRLDLIQMLERNMGEVIRFIPKAEIERARLIREARALYDSIFPPADPASELRDETSASDTISGGNAYRSDGGLLS